jgi:hypothetical protein
MKKLKHIISFHYRKYFKKTNVPSYAEKRAILENYTEKFSLQVMVETGTFRGDTVEYFKNKFSKLYSIELSEELAEKAAARFKNNSHIKIICGDSGDVLQDLVKEIDAPALYWLDGHYSSEFFIGNEYFKTALGEKQTPVKKELQTLLNDRHKHVILIDDARLFTGTNDYPSMNEIKKMAARSPHGYTVSLSKDIIHLIPAK